MTVRILVVLAVAAGLIIGRVIELRRAARRDGLWPAPEPCSDYEE